MWQVVNVSGNELKKEIRSTGESISTIKIVPAGCCQNKVDEMNMVQLVVYVYGNAKFMSYTKKKIFLLKDSIRADQFFAEEKNKIEQKYSMMQKPVNNSISKEFTGTSPVVPSYVARNDGIGVRKPCGGCAKKSVK